jgi:hypothetical protein
MFWVHPLQSSDYFSTKSSFINALFSPLHETLYVGRVKLFAEASELFTHSVC